MRYFIAASCLSVSMLISIFVMVLPNFKPDKPGIFAIILLVLGLLLIGPRMWRRPPVAMCVLILSAILVFPLIVVYRAFGEVDMMSMLFHINVGTAGLSPMIFRSEIIAVAASLIIFNTGVFALSAIASFRFFPLACCIGIWALNPITVYYVESHFFPPPDVDLIAEISSVEKLSLPAGIDAPDVVHIYLEGVDRRFLKIDPEGLAARSLMEIEAMGLSFTGVAQIAGTGWSLAGVVASQCGLPLLPRGNLKASLADTARQKFMPDYICLSDHMRNMDYQLTFVMGTTSDFAGVSFFNTHGYSKVVTREDMSEILTDSEKDAALTAGSFYDDAKVFDVALGFFDEMLADDRPLALTVETMGPHGVPSFLSHNCTKTGKAEVINTVLPAVQCLIPLASDFIGRVKEKHKVSGRDRDLKIIVQSDHINHSKTAVPKMEEDRYNFVVFIGGDGRVSVNSRQGSMIDLYPTLLSWLGLGPDVQRGGLGVSLLGSDGSLTLAERFDLRTLDRIIQRSPELFSVLWRGSE